MKPPDINAKLMGGTSTWAITGVAGFIGSNLAEALLSHGQVVRGADNFSNGKRENLESIREAVGDARWRDFTFVEGDITEPNVCGDICSGADYVLHEAAVVSVPRSFREPMLSVRTNILGFLNVLLAAREAHVKKFVYASSSSVYGDSPDLPKKEPNIGRPLSPYALGKYADEVLAELLAANDGFPTIGLRYFNVFGKRQKDDGEYAAVIPKFIRRISRLQAPVIFGDGETSRDFSYVDNIVDANILATLVDDTIASGSVFNIAVGQRTSLNSLVDMLKDILARRLKSGAIQEIQPSYQPFRPGDIRHSQADIALAEKTLGYVPRVLIKEGLERMIAWMLDHRMITP
jgi:UDP-N-acetylglucosamine 4-epimerase